MTVAWVEQVINHNSSSLPAVLSLISFLVKKMVETEFAFEPRNIKMYVFWTEQREESSRSGFDREIANGAQLTQDSKNSGRR